MHAPVQYNSFKLFYYSRELYNYVTFITVYIVSLVVCLQVLVKSYVQLPDTDGVPDSKAAEEAWQAHKKRNDSVIINLFHVCLIFGFILYLIRCLLFQGLLKSTITCLSCGKKKVMFEPFVSLSVPIPRGKSSCSYHVSQSEHCAREQLVFTSPTVLRKSLALITY